MSVSISSRAKGHASFDSRFNNLLRCLVPSFPGFFAGVHSGGTLHCGSFVKYATILHGLYHISLSTPYTPLPELTRALFIDIRDPLQRRS